jgi:hypothetical protein
MRINFQKFSRKKVKMIRESNDKTNSHIYKYLKKIAFIKLQ